MYRSFICSGSRTTESIIGIFMRLEFLLRSGMLLGQTPQPDARDGRDIGFTRYGKPAGPSTPARVEIPRSYALVIGISEYQKLPARGQLRFPVRDAAAVYSALIGPEAGQFPAENVHRLLGNQATLAN